jgi:hypothetical protein
MVAEAAQVQRLSRLAVEAAVAAAHQMAAVQHLPLERLAELHLWLAQLQHHMQLTSAAGEAQPLMPDQVISAVAVVALALRRQQLLLAEHLLCRLEVEVVVAQLPSAMRRAMAGRAATPEGLQQPQVVAVLPVLLPQAEAALREIAPSVVRAVVVVQVTLVVLASQAATEASPEAAEAVVEVVHPRVVLAAMVLLVV